MRNSASLRTRIESSRIEVEGQIAFVPESERISNVMLKLARGHAAFGLSQPCRDEPYHFWCGPLASLPEETRSAFDSVHIQQVFGEVGSRNMQRMLVTTLQSKFGKQHDVGMIINDWIDVQEDQYRYLAIDDAGELVIRIIVAEYFACEVAWRH
jgi:hypothetical protein